MKFNIKKLTKKQLYIGIAIIAVILFIFNPFNKKEEGQASFVEVKYGNLEQIVSVTGKVQATKNIDLTFDQSGKTQGINVKAGDPIGKGQLLASLENGELLARKTQAEAALEAQLAKLEEVKKGSSPEDLQITQTQLDKAKADLDNIYLSIPNTLKKAYIAVDTALKQTIYSFFDYNYMENIYRLNYGHCHPNAGWESNQERPDMDVLLKNWDGKIGALTFTGDNYSEVDSSIKVSLDNLEKFEFYFNRLNETLIIDCYLTDAQKTVVNSNRILMTTAMSGLNTAISNVVSANNSIIAQKNNIDIYEKQVEYKKAPGTPEQIAYQKAQVKNAQGNLDLINAQLAKTYLFSPVDGKVGSVNLEVGELAVVGTNGITVVSNDPYQIESYISENDIASVKLENKATVTLDAFGQQRKFEATVVGIDSSATIVDGLASYKTIFNLNVDEEIGIKSGMTANIDILADARENVLVVPNRLLIRSNGDIKAKIMDGEEEKEVEVIIGIKGNDGNAEIISGLEEGDKVIIER